MHLSSEHHRRRIGSATKKFYNAESAGTKMDIRLSETGHVTAVRWRFAVCAAGTAVVAPAALPSTPDRTIYHPWERARRCRARVQSVHITRSGHTQRANERERTSSQPHSTDGPSGVCATRSKHVRDAHTRLYLYIYIDIYVCVGALVYTRTRHTCARRCPAPAGLPSSFKRLTDDRHGTERRRVRIHHIFYVPPLVYPIYPIRPLAWSSARPATARCRRSYWVQAFPGNIFKRVHELCLLRLFCENSFYGIKRSCIYISDTNAIHLIWKSSIV